MMARRPGYIFDNHKRLVEKLGIIIDEASEEYDFTQYVKDWAIRRAEARQDAPFNI
jgi:hypothetical protein